MNRRDELATGLREVRQRIERACRDAGRTPDGIILVVVTKTYPASDVELLHELGVHDIGENRHPEAADKKDALGAIGDDLTWHFIGGLQSNKAAAVAAYADVVQSVDRVKLVPQLRKGAERAGHQVDCLVQVNLDSPGTADSSDRAGVDPAGALDVAGAVADAEHLRLRGVMAVAPLGADPAPAFATLADVAAAVRREHPGADVVSAGMSGDLEQAIAAGATHVRVGRSVLGERASLR